MCLVDFYPAANTKNKIKRYDQQGGGPVPTALATLGKLGKSSLLISLVGEDRAGEYLIEELQRFFVDTQHIIKSNISPTSEAFIIVDERNGNRTVFLQQSGKDVQIKDQIDFSIVKNCKMVHLDGHDVPLSLDIAKAARKYGVRVSIDIGSDRFVPQELLELTDVAIVSQSFADAQLIKDDPAASARKLVEYGIKCGAVTCGRNGSYFANIKEDHYFPAFKVNVIDSTGAGDVFHGAALFAILENFSIKDIAVWASAAAALKCGKMGGKIGIPNKHDIIQFLDKKGQDIQFIRRKLTQ